MATATIILKDNPDGTLSIDARHSDEFNPELKSHAVLDALVNYLPQIVEPAQEEPK